MRILVRTTDHPNKRCLAFVPCAETKRNSAIFPKTCVKAEVAPSAVPATGSLYLPPTGELAFREGFTIYNAESSGPLHARLARHAGYVCSEYFGDAHQGGTIINGIRHEDLRQLSFADASFDLVLSSDVLEHMPSPYDAHRDIFRVLKPGGRHIFTVPFNAQALDDDVRARLVDGRIEYLAEALYHGDPVRPDEGILVWTIFGTRMMQTLEAIGFVASAWNLYEPESGIIGPGNIVFEAHKPPASRVVIGCPPAQQGGRRLEGHGGSVVRRIGNGVRALWR